MKQAARTMRDQRRPGAKAGPSAAHGKQAGGRIILAGPQGLGDAATRTPFNLAQRTLAKTAAQSPLSRTQRTMVEASTRGPRAVAQRELIEGMRVAPAAAQTLGSEPCGRFDAHRKGGEGSFSSVAQRRIPEMGLAFITANKAMAVEMLKHAMKNMDPKEFLALNAATSHPVWWGYDEITAALEEGGPTVVYEWYQLIYAHSGEEKRYVSTLGDPDTVAATPIQTTLVNEKVGSYILPKLAELLGNADLLRAIFGPACDLSHVQGVIGAILAALDGHVTARTCPMVMVGDKAHNDWVGVAGMAGGGLQATIGKQGFNGVLAGSARGYATLVHEFSHLAAGTKDYAYGMSDMAALTTAKRMANAETYAQAFLEVFSGAEPARYYNPELVADTERKTADPEDASAVKRENRQRRMAAISELMVALWNSMDNAYGFLKLAATLGGVSAAVRAKMTESVHAATFPYQPDLAAYPAASLALIEDRTRVLKALVPKSGVIAALKAKGVNKAAMEADFVPGDPERLVALALSGGLSMGPEAALLFVRSAVRITPLWQEARDLANRQDEAGRLLPLVQAESATVLALLNTGAKAPYATLSGLINQYRATGINPNAIQADSRILTSAIARGIQRV